MRFIAPQDVPDYDVVPGTVYIVQGTHQAGYSHKDIILVPTPSSDAKDPLKWSKWRKAYHLFLLTCYSALLGALTNWESVIYLDLTAVYDIKIDQLNIGQAVCLLMLGVGNVFFVPLSNKLGRRAIYIWTLLLVLVSQIWLSCSEHIGDYQGAHVILGVGAAPFEALVAISISDVYFVHERGGKLGVYVFGLAFGSFIGPICAGYMAVNQGWRWIYHWGCFLTGVLLVAFFFTFEESRFLRSADLHEATQLHAVPLEEVRAGDSATHNRTIDMPKKADSEVDEADMQRIASNGPRVGQVFDAAGFKIQYSLWHMFPESWTEVAREFWRPLRVAALPAVFWCGINYGTCVSWLAVMGTTVAEIFAPPPYLFTNNAIGLVWISPMIGSLLGAYFSGPLNDRLTLYLSNRNRGFYEPEFRLWAFIPDILIMPAGLIIYGTTAANGLPWIAPVVGMGLVGFGLSVGGTVTMAYILDCYKEIDSQAVTTIILIRNIVGFGITWGIQPWISGMGLQNTFVFVGCLSAAITGVAVFFIVFGKGVRRWTAPRYAELAKRNAVE